MNSNRVREIHYLKPEDWTENELMRSVSREVDDVRDGRLRPAVIRWTAFANDARPLWEIPEVVAACRAMISSGYISLLHLNLEPRRLPEVWGAIDVYLCGNGNVASLDPLASLRPDDGFGVCMAVARELADVLAASRGRTLH